jgi:oligopeptide/dipeptide ABC transporter ATP-binding protein
MYSGQIVEAGDTQEVLNNPLHPYTKALLDSSTSANVEPKSPLKTIPGIVLPITTNVRGCRFANRCFKAQDVCQSVMPPSHKTSPNNLYLCHF